MSYKLDPLEWELVEGCMQNDRQSQRALYNKYKDAMYTILYRMTSTEEEAADALQDAFVEVFRSLKNYKRLSSLGAWIKTIVVRAGIAKQKKRIYFSELEQASEEDQRIEWDPNLTGEYLEKAIMRLPAGYKNVFLLLEVEGYSHKEAAEMLGISPGTSKSQLFHAKKMLQKELKELMY